MNAAIRPYMTTGIALVGASVIAVAPIKPVTDLPDIAIAMPTTSSAAYELAAFPEDLLALVGPLLAQLDPGQVFDLLESVILANGGLFGGLALVVDQLLDGLTQLLAEGVVPVVDALVPVLEAVFDGLTEVLAAGVVPVVATLLAGLTPIVALVVGGLAVIVAELVPLLLPVTVGLGVLLGGLGLGLAGLLAGLGGIFIPLAATAPAVAGATTFAATDIENEAAAKTFDLAIGPTDKGQEATLPEQASEVAEVAVDPEAEKPTDVLTEVQANAPEQAQDGLQNAIENQEDVTEPEESEAAATDTAGSTSNGTASESGSGTANAGDTGSTASESGASNGSGDSDTAGSTHSGNSASSSAGADKADSSE